VNARVKVVALVAVAAAAAFTAVQLFPRAFPAIALENKLTHSTARAAADSFFRAHALADSATRRAVRFNADGEVMTYVDLAAGGPDSLNAMVRGTYAAPFDWSVRAFEPGQVSEARVDFAPDGRVVGFNRRLADSVARPDIGADSARALAWNVMTGWLLLARDQWTVSTTSFKTRKPSERVDRTITFERTDRKVGDAPLRLDVVIAGDLPSEGRPYVHVPEAFNRRYAEMRSANDLYAIIATVGAFILFGLGVWTIRRFSYHRLLRWRESLMAGAVVGVFMAAAGFNSMSSGWYGYDTATPAAIYQAILVVSALAQGVFAAGLVGLTLVAAEAASRAAFPRHVDWWKAWSERGTREVAGQVAGGYVVACIAFAYVAAFYLITRSVFGWWVPSEILDNPNQIATPAPWIDGIAFSLQAGVWEEALFRALPLSLLSLWVGNRANRTAWMVAGVVATALVFGFAHANYPSWPPYSRGVEIFLDACFWGLLFLRFGAIPVMLAHFLYDVVLFSMFTATGTAPEYRISMGFALLAVFLPALAVAAKAIAQRGLAPLPDSARFGGWTRPVEAEAAPAPVQQARVAPMSERSRQLALMVLSAGLVAAIAIPARETRGPAFVAGKAEAMRVADSMLASRGVPPNGWRKLATTSSDTQAMLTRFLRQNKIDTLIGSLTRTYATPAWWVVRYVHSEGPLSERAEEWRVRLYPDGKPLDVRHILADSAPGASLSVDSARAIAQAAARKAGINLAKFRESDVDETARPNRRDVQITWIDTSLKLPAGANARAWVNVAGDEPLVVRRGIQLPESFHRADRTKQTRAVAMGGLLAMLLLGGLATAVLYVGKKRPAIVTDEVVSGKAKWAMIAVVGVAMLSDVANGWSDSTFSYDTASPWINHVAQTLILASIAPVIGVALFTGLWNAMEMLRRRAGIVAWPDPHDGFAAQDAVVAGLGFGALFQLASLTSAWMSAPAIAAAPTTSLTQEVPLLVAALSIPIGVVVSVATLAIPVLAIIALTPSKRNRWLIFVGVILLSMALIAPVADSIERVSVGPTTGVLAIVRLAAILAAIVYWGKRSALTWIVAALTASALSDTHGVMTAATTIERLGHSLAVVVTLGLLTALIRHATRLPERPLRST
jgi:hypothetical protein